MHGIVHLPSGLPAAGIVVSCAAAVTTTDLDGRFTLPAHAGPGAFVVLRRPEGHSASPWWRPVPADDSTELRFDLIATPQSLPYEWVHLTDTHMSLPRDATDTSEGFGLYRDGSHPDQIRAFLAALPELAPEAQSIMVTGDLVDHGLAEEFEAYIAAMSTSPVPVHLIPGNHDHMNGSHGSIVSRNDYLTNVGDTTLYERYLGPRWYSFDVPGLHVVTLDWHSHELGIDHELQNEWVRNDLATLPEGSPWILLFHDQPSASILDELPWQPVAAFSGHWHTSRVVDVDGTLHVNSPTSFFASLDYSPPAFRRVRWDGERITMRTQTLPTGALSRELVGVDTATFAATEARTPPLGGTDTEDHVLWSTTMSGAGHRQRVAVQGGVVYAGGQIEDRPAGSVEAFDLESGALLWRTAMASAVKTTPALGGGLVIAAEVSGDLVALDAATGERRWRLASSDPYRRFAWGAPTVHGDRVYLGDQSDLRAVDVQTGKLVWRRADLSPHHNLVNHAAPLLVDDLLVMGFWPTPQHPIGLDATTGSSVWQTAEPNGDDPFLALKKLLIMGTAAYDECTDRVVMPAFGHTTCVERATGRTVWTQPHEGGFSPTTPLVTAAGYVVTVTGRGLRLLDRESGETLWDTVVTGDAPFPMASYTKTPHPVIAPPVLVGDELVLPGLDGVVRRFDLAGRLLGQAQLSTPIAAGLVHADGRLVAVGVDGSIQALRDDIAAGVVRTAEEPLGVEVDA